MLSVQLPKQSEKLKKRDTTGPNLNKKTLNEWKGQFPGPIVEQIEGETRFNCEICKKFIEGMHSKHSLGI